MSVLAIIAVSTFMLLAATTTAVIIVKLFLPADRRSEKTSIGFELGKMKIHFSTQWESGQKATKHLPVGRRRRSGRQSRRVFRSAGRGRK